MLYVYILFYFNTHLEKKKLTFIFKTCNELRDDNLGKIIQFILEFETLVTTDIIMTLLTYQEG